MAKHDKQKKASKAQVWARIRNYAIRRIHGHFADLINMADACAADHLIPKLEMQRAQLVEKFKAHMDSL